MDSRILDPPHAQFGGSLGGMVGFPYHLSHHHVYELAGHQLQSASAVPFSIDGLLNGSCAASVGNSNPLLSSGCGMNGDNQHYKLTGKPHYYTITSPLGWLLAQRQKQKQRQHIAIQVILLVVCLKGKPNRTRRQKEYSSPPSPFPSPKAEDAPKQKQCSCQPVNTRARKCLC